MLGSTLPDDIATLKRMLASRDETIARLLAEIARLKRWQYGRSSERMAELMFPAHLRRETIVHALASCGWTHRDRQQRRGTIDPAAGPGQAQLSVRRL